MRDDEGDPPASPPRRRRLSRTFARARWGEYRRLLEAALAAGYRIAGVEEWVRGEVEGERIVVLRHDVDQHPRSALAMAAIEDELGVRGSWYFRWRTADADVVGQLRASGAAVGLHYETLSRLVLEAGGAGGSERGTELVPRARELLRAEVAAFAAIHGLIESVCPHGDTRVASVRNSELMSGQDPASFGVELDASEAMRGRGLARWVTDRSTADGGWVDGVDPERLLADGVSPMLWVIHPNNWVSGPSLWADRLLAAALPAARSGAGARGHLPLRTGIDAPPL